MDREERIKKLLKELEKQGMDISRLEKELIPHTKEEVNLKTRKKKA